MIREVQEVSKSGKFAFIFYSQQPKDSKWPEKSFAGNSMNKNFHDSITRRNPQPNLRRPGSSMIGSL